jgi:hypothetical protein
MKTSLLTLLFCCSLLSLSAQSGILKTIGGAAKNKAEQQDFNSSRSNKEKGHLQQERKKSAEAPGSAPESAAPAPPDSTAAPETGTTEPVTPSLIAPAKYNSSYTFTQQLTYAIDDPSEKDIDTVTYYYSEGAVMMTMPRKETSTLVDFVNESMITFDENKKTAMAMNSGWASRIADKQAAENDDVTVTKTGQTKQILGYTCDEYVIQGKTKTICWVTSETGLDYSKTMAAIARSMPNIKPDDFSFEGLMMETTGYNKKGVANVHMILTEIGEETVVKALNGYTVTGL